jgi:photosystem II stability/assembly factor-like uncharacterized protein
MANILTNDMGSVFLQPAGPNGTQYWLGCHDIGDVSVPEGDITRDICPDPAGRVKWKVMTRSQGSGGEITVDITFPVGKTADYLEEIIKRKCPVGIYVNWLECGQRNWPNYYDRGFVLEDAILTSRTFANSAMAGTDGGAPTRSTRTFSFSAASLEEYYSLIATLRAAAGGAVVTGIKSASDDQCLGACGAPTYIGQTIYASIAALAAAEGQVFVSNDYGVTWAVVPGGAAITPFAVAENFNIAVFPMTPTTTRVLIARTTTNAAAAQVAYSDDGGTTFSALTACGTTLTEFFGAYPQSIFALNRENIWGCTRVAAGAVGNIYKSADGGATWTLSYASAAEALNVIHFADENTGVCFGLTGDCFATTDGGAHWVAKTAPFATATTGCLCMDSNRFWAATVAGTLWYSQNGGTTWAQRVLPMPAGASAIAALGAMDMIDDYVFSIVGTATVGGNPFGAIWRTWDGGANWTSVLTPATIAQGLVAVDMIDVNNIFAGGGVTIGTSTILQAAMS